MILPLVLNGPATAEAGDLLYSTTVFVSSLPYNATTTDLVTHFSFIGPVHHGFIAKDKETGTSKGVGYVTYAMREDADRAIEELDGGAFGDKGRKIRVLLADRRVSAQPQVPVR